MSRIWLRGLLGGLSAVAFGLLLHWWLRADAPHGARTRPTKRAGLARASAELLAKELPGVQLEQDLGELRTVRPGITRQSGADREQLSAYEEQRGPRERVLYFFGGSPPRLQRVQIATQLAQVDAIAARVLALQQRLGPPTGVWDCPAARGQLPTRRYSFVRDQAAAADVFAILAERALATYYVTSRQQLRASLQQADCRPTPPERATRFPMLPAGALK
jgi:hypothetical protein